MRYGAADGNRRGGVSADFPGKKGRKPMTRTAQRGLAAATKLESRNTKSETNSKREIPMLQTKRARCIALVFGAFEFRACFEFRASDFVFPACVHGARMLSRKGFTPPIFRPAVSRSTAGRSPAWPAASGTVCGGLPSDSGAWLRSWAPGVGRGTRRWPSPAA